MSGTKSAAPAPFFREGHAVSLLLSVEEARDSFVQDGTSLRLHLSVITVTDEGKPRNVWGLDEWLGGLMLGSLQIRGTGFSNKVYASDTAQGTDLGAGDYKHRRSMDAHGFRLEYMQPYSVDLKGAEAMVKTLKTLDRKMKAAEERDGFVQDFPAFVRRAAKAMGIDTITLPVEANTYGSYDRGAYRTMGLEGGLYHIELVVDAWKQAKEIPGVVHQSR
jgi:hypothetical protein